MPDTPPVVRPATAADDAALLALDRVGWTPGSGFPSVLDREPTAFFSERRRPDDVLVAEVDGDVAGYVVVTPKGPFLESAHVFALWSLVVSVRARRRGVATALLEAAERAAAGRGATKLSLHVLGTNTAAQRLYERHGYLVEGRHRDEYLIDGAAVDDLTLAKWLG
jgi:ribosomal protein S18 acetylase RimI-like enzyme